MTNFMWNLCELSLYVTFVWTFHLKVMLGDDNHVSSIQSLHEFYAKPNSHEIFKNNILPVYILFPFWGKFYLALLFDSYFLPFSLIMVNHDPTFNIQPLYSFWTNAELHFFILIRVKNILEEWKHLIHINYALML